MAVYTVTLSEAENKALSYVALSQQDWIDNAVHERCRLAIDDIARIAIEKCFETGTQVPSTKDELVDLAFVEGWVKTGAERNAELTVISEQGA